MSSSDTSDEELDKFREAVDTQFHNFTKNRNGPSTKPEQTKEKSLRRIQDEDDQFYNLGVTPEFQNYVAKQLAKTLDLHLHSRLVDVPENAVKKRRKCGGIRLFSNSESYIQEDEIELKRLKHTVINKVDSKHFEPCAVSGDYVLSGKETKHWAKGKGKVFTYKKRSGELTLMEPPFE